MSHRKRRTEDSVSQDRNMGQFVNVRTESSLRLSESSPVHVAFDSSSSVTRPRYDMHYALELGVVLRGKMRRLYRTWDTLLGPGEAWYCGTWERHGWAVEGAPCEVLVFAMRPDLLADPEPVRAVRHDWLAPFAAPPQQRPRVPPEERQQMLALARHLRARLRTGARLREAWLLLLVFEMLALLERGWASPARPAVAAYSSGSVSKAVELVFGCRRLVTSEEAAAACAMSGRTFRRAFEALMGISFSKFALRYRLSAAAAELTHSNDPLKVIAAAWGFTDASHLHRCFVQHYRCTPHRYRQEAAGASVQRASGTSSDRSRGRPPGKRGSDA